MFLVMLLSTVCMIVMVATDGVRRAFWTARHFGTPASEKLTGVGRKSPAARHPSRAALVRPVMSWLHVATGCTAIS